MRPNRSKRPQREDVVAASLSEIVLFFLFFCLILLGSVWAADGLKAEAYRSNCGDQPQECVDESELRKFTEICGDDGQDCVPRADYDHVRGELAKFGASCPDGAAECVSRALLVAFEELCGESPLGCVGLSEHEQLKGWLALFHGACGPDPQRCISDAELEAFERICGLNADDCVSPEEHKQALKTNSDYAFHCGDHPENCVPGEVQVELNDAKEKLVQYDGFCGPDPKKCTNISSLTGLQAELAGLYNNLELALKLCGSDLKDCVGPDHFALISGTLRDYISACGDDPKKCVPLVGLDHAKERLKFFEGLCGKDGERCVELADFVAVELERDEFKEICATSPIACEAKIGELSKKAFIDTTVFLKESQGYKFESGSFEISDVFKETFLKGNDDVDAGLDIIRGYLGEGETIENGKGLVVEVIGHTDEEAYSSCNTNTDHDLIDIVNGENVNSLKVCDNVALGMARAVSTVLYMREMLGDKFKNLPIIPFSAGPLQSERFKLAPPFRSAEEKKRRLNTETESRRRIEVRISTL